MTPHAGAGFGLRTPSSQALQQSPHGSDAAAAAFAEATEGDAQPDDSQVEAADEEAAALAAQLRLQVAFPVGAAGGGGGNGPRTQLRLPPRLEALIGKAGAESLMCQYEPDGGSGLSSLAKFIIMQLIIHQICMPGAPSTVPKSNWSQIHPEPGSAHSTSS